MPLDKFLNHDTPMAELEESIAILSHINAHTRTHEHLVVVEPHVPLETKHHTDEQYLSIVHARVRNQAQRALNKFKRL